MTCGMNAKSGTRLMTDAFCQLLRMDESFDRVFTTTAHLKQILLNVVLLVKVPNECILKNDGHRFEDRY